MNADDFRKIALSLAGAEEGSHMSVADFRVNGHIFATLAHEAKGYGNLKFTPEQQAAAVADAPDIFLPIAGGWGRMGMTHVRLAAVDEATLKDALHMAWRGIAEKPKTVRKKKPTAS